MVRDILCVFCPLRAGEGRKLDNSATNIFPKLPAQHELLGVTGVKCLEQFDVLDISEGREGDREPDVPGLAGEEEEEVMEVVEGSQSHLLTGLL